MRITEFQNGAIINRTVILITNFTYFVFVLFIGTNGMKQEEVYPSCYQPQMILFYLQNS